MKVDEMLKEAGKRAENLFSDAGGEIRGVRRSIADTNDGDMAGAFALGLVVGALVGAAVALLMTPVSGQEARRRIGERAEQMRQRDNTATDAWRGSTVGEGGNGAAQTYRPASPAHGTPVV